MIQISINGFSIDINTINIINIIEVDDEEKIYVAIHTVNGIIRTITNTDEDFSKWDSLCDVCSVKGNKKQLINELKEELFL